MTMILVVGGADTGRAPMVAALLRRRVAEQQLGWDVGSAGVLGHDDDAPEVEARDAMTALGLDIANHRARSVSAALVAAAALLLAVDGGTARVLAMRFPEAAPRIRALGELAGRKRDIPDPFRMQVGVWMSYARELDELLRDALPTMRALVTTTNELPAINDDDQRPATSDHQALTSDDAHQRTATSEVTGDGVDTQRTQAATRIERLLWVAAEMPDVLDWEAARRHIEAALAQAAVPLSAADLALAYTSVLRAALTLMSTPPTAGQIAALHTAVRALRGAVEQQDIQTLSSQLARWSSL